MKRNSKQYYVTTFKIKKRFAHFWKIIKITKQMLILNFNFDNQNLPIFGIEFIKI